MGVALTSLHLLVYSVVATIPPPPSANTASASAPAPPAPPASPLKTPVTPADARLVQLIGECVTFIPGGNKSVHMHSIFLLDVR